MVVIGVDAHKRTHTASAVEEATGRALGDVTVPADGDGHLRLLEFARGHSEQRLWAVENCRHVSGALERFLLGAGETVLRVPPNMMSGARKSERTRGKSDPIDATAVAGAAIRQPDLPRVFLAGPEREIALLVGHRAHLVHERTRLSKRLRWLLHDLDRRSSRPIAPSAGSPRSSASTAAWPAASPALRCGSAASTWPGCATSPGGSMRCGVSLHRSSVATPRSCC